MIDIHSHILHGIDDGARDLQMSLEMIRISVKEGTKDIIATPHYRRGYFNTSYKEIKESVFKLNEIIKQRKIECNIHFGQEVYCSNNIIKDLKNGSIGTINDGEYMLIELPINNTQKDIIEYMYELRIRGITPIIAHPERYKYVIKDITFLNDFIKEGCIFQMNSGSILGEYGRDVKRTARKLIDNYIYSFIGSDGHNNIGRTTGIKEGFNLLEELNEDLYNSILINSRRLIDNKHVKFSGATIKKKLFYIFG